MGNQVIILFAGVLVLVGVYTIGLNNSSKALSDNANKAYAEQTAREINNAAVEVGLRTLADSLKWRSSINNLQLSGGSSNLTFKDTLFGTDSAVVLRSTTYFSAGKDTASSLSQVVVKGTGFVPKIVRGAITAFGPLDNTLSDMIIDGRNWNYDNLTIRPNSGMYAISTGQPTFVNTQSARLGGTSQPPLAPVDIAPAFPESPFVVETSSSWPGGWPTSPDAAMGYPEGTLKQMAITRSVPGSQYVTAYSQLTFPIRGVTYLEVPNGTYIGKKDLGMNPEGIIVLHSPKGDAFWEWLLTSPGSGTIKGLLIFDKLHHIHTNILGAVVFLSPVTEGLHCQGNAGKQIRYSEETIKKATGAGASGDASWKSRLKVLAWYE
ncbi:MAG: hypothetical protein HW412_654 [Bacteroidetes bacterium]|nr:hypothetical protein [Bacteroidota bacterium]